MYPFGYWQGFLGPRFLWIFSFFFRIPKELWVRTHLIQLQLRLIQCCAITLITIFRRLVFFSESAENADKASSFPETLSRYCFCSFPALCRIFAQKLSLGSSLTPVYWRICPCVLPKMWASLLEVAHKNTMGRNAYGLSGNPFLEYIFRYNLKTIFK